MSCSRECFCHIQKLYCNWKSPVLQLLNDLKYSHYKCPSHFPQASYSICQCFTEMWLIKYLFFFQYTFFWPCYKQKMHWDLMISLNGFIAIDKVVSLPQTPFSHVTLKQFFCCLYCIQFVTLAIFFWSRVISFGSLVCSESQGSL